MTPNQSSQDSHNNHPQHHQHLHIPPTLESAFQRLQPSHIQYQIPHQPLRSPSYPLVYSPASMAQQQQQQPPFGASSGYFRTFSQHSGSATPQVPTPTAPGSYREPPAIDSPSMASRTTPEPSSSASHTAGPSPQGAPSPPSMGTMPAPSALSMSAPSHVKRKRKDGKAKASTVDQSEEDEAEKAKRTKTQRACDPCRRKKIRCDVIADSDPPLCQHCQQYRYDCTFYLPITETRFKKKRLEEAAAASATEGSSGDVKPVISRGPSGDDATMVSVGRGTGDTVMSNKGESSKEVKIYGEFFIYTSYAYVQGWSMPAAFGCGGEWMYPPGEAGMARLTTPAGLSRPPRQAMLIAFAVSLSRPSLLPSAPFWNVGLGPTSLSFIMHSTPSIPVKAFENYDARYQETWEVSKTGDGFIQVTDHSPPQHPATLGKALDPNRLGRDVLTSMINAYFHEVAPQFPILSGTEFIANSSLPPVLLYSVCSVAAARRGVNRETFEELRAAVNQVIKTDDVLSTASVVNVQALLILGMSGDVHSTSIQSAMTAAWLRLGAAIRMAQDL
ncbi:hypothetical protein FRB90_001453, partial [Tulasnella sp. 427]